MRTTITRPMPYKVFIGMSRDFIRHSLMTLPTDTIFLDSSDDIDDMLDGINDVMEDDTHSGAKLIILAHGDDEADGTILLPYDDDDLAHLSDFLEQIPIPNNKRLLADLYACHSGAKIEKIDSDNRGSYEEKLKNNQLVFINAGNKHTMVKYSVSQINSSRDEVDPVKLAMQKMLNSAETVKVLTRKNDQIEVYKYSAPKPKSAADLTHDKIREFLRGELERFCNFLEIPATKTGQYLADFAEQLTDVAIDNYKINALAIESMRGRAQYIAPYVQSGVDINAKTFGGMAAIHYAACATSENTLEELLRLGANANAVTDKNVTALHLAADYDSDGLPLVSCLLKHGADTAIVDNMGLSVLHYAAKKHTDVMKLLIETKGMDPNQLDKTGLTALHTAVIFENLDGVKYLLEERGVDQNQKGPRNASILYLATVNGFANIVKYLLEERKMDKELMEEEILHVAVSKGKVDIVEYLLRERGMNVNQLDHQGVPALYYAAKQPDMIKCLMANEADIAILAPDGRALTEFLKDKMSKESYDIFRKTIDDYIQYREEIREGINDMMEAEEFSYHSDPDDEELAESEDSTTPSRSPSLTPETERRDDLKRRIESEEEDDDDEQKPNKATKLSSNPSGGFRTSSRN